MSFTILDTYPPGTAQNTCYFCRAAQRQLNGRPERIIDTLINVMYEGFVTVCETCVQEMGSMIGMLTPKAANQLKERVAELENEVLNLKNKASLAEDVTTSINRWAELSAKESKTSE